MRRYLLPFIVIVLFAAACTGGSSKKSEPTDNPAAASATTALAEPAPTSTTTLAPVETINGVPVTPMVAGPPIDLPKGLVLYLEGGCQSCDQPATSLDRVWRDLAGTFHSDRLFAPAANEYITSIAVGGNGANILIGLCRRAYCGGVSTIQPGARVTFIASIDGGITWNDIGSVDGGAWALTTSPPFPGGIIFHEYQPSPGAAFASEFATIPSKYVIPSTPGSPAVPSDPWSMFDLNGTLVYRGENHTSLWGIPGDSQPILDPILPPSAVVLQATGLDPASPYHWAIEWTQDGGPPAPAYIGLMDTSPQTPPRIFGLPTDGTAFFGNPAAAGPKSLAVTAWLPAKALASPRIIEGFAYAPAILDLDSGQIRAIRQLTGRALGGGEHGSAERARIRGAGTGSFVAVQGAGDCLNVRAAPTKSAQVFGCFKDGVLLSHLGESTQADGVTWASVKTPTGSAGWASLEFLSPGSSGTTVTGTQPPGVRSGDLAVDAVLDALASGDRERVLSLVKWFPIACVAEQLGLGGPPKCPDGIAAGTVFDTLPGGCGEGTYAIRGTLADQFIIFRPQPLYAVWREKRDPGAWISFDTVALYGDPGFTTEIYLQNGRISGYVTCGSNPAQRLSKIPASEYLIRPR